MSAIDTIRAKADMFRIQGIRVQNRSQNIEGSLQLESEKKHIVFEQELYFNLFGTHSFPELMSHISAAKRWKTYNLFYAINVPLASLKPKEVYLRSSCVQAIRHVRIALIGFIKDKDTSMPSGQYFVQWY